MASFVTLQNCDLEEISSAYGMNFSGLEALPGGHANSSFLLSVKNENEKFVLTVFEKGSVSAIGKMVRLLKYLESHDFPTVRPVSAAGVEPVIRLKNRPAVLKKYITGQVTRYLSEEILADVGRQLARLHKLPAPDFLPIGHSYPSEIFPVVIGNGADPEYESWLKNEIDSAKPSLPESLPKGLTHGDLFFDNLLTEDGVFRAIIDFDNASRDRLSYDLGMAIVGLCSRNEILELNRAGALVKGYQGVRILDDREMKFLQPLTVYAAAATSAWRFWKYRIETPSPDEKADKHLEMVRLAEWIKAISSERFQAEVFG